MRPESGSPAPTRRQFLAAAASVTAAACITSAAPAPRDACTFGFGTYGTKGLSTEQAIAVIADAGYDSIMLDAAPGFDAEPQNLSRDRRRDVRKLLVDRGLRFTSAMDDLHADPSDAINAKHEDRVKAIAQLCRDLAPDQPAVLETMVGGKAPWAEAKPLFVRRLASWAKVAEANDITLAIKAHANTSMDKPEQVVELLREVGSPRARMCYDYSHFVHNELPLARTIELSLPWTAIVVIKDAVMDNGKRAYKLPNETGQIDYPALLRQFYAGGYRGDFNCEVSAMIWKQPGYDPIQTARRCYALVAPAFVAAGVPRPHRPS